jgi:hypothetical protein
VAFTSFSYRFHFIYSTFIIVHYTYRVLSSWVLAVVVTSVDCGVRMRRALYIVKLSGSQAAIFKHIFLLTL